MGADLIIFISCCGFLLSGGTWITLLNLSESWYLYFKISYNSAIDARILWGVHDQTGRNALNIASASRRYKINVNFLSLQKLMSKQVNKILLATKDYPLYFMCKIKFWHLFISCESVLQSWTLAVVFFYIFSIDPKIFQTKYLWSLYLKNTACVHTSPRAIPWIPV